ncbi:scavenger receptor cysteine-rich type 1 protein M160-like isoform X2 [Ostrea edulis]|uniref:scavenger receptor cysteine-rich type 1 protein M160-like isoform X2 n=1 Tax=Ostrea edulis TaxID=37623 RepID=UPI0024AEEA25|nr:scavenger receptor cysteine-rich type 1 protein M160-like isoform X2 [Ostrea edulis]
MLRFGMQILLFLLVFEIVNTTTVQHVRLVGDEVFDNMGRLEVSVNGTWYVVCSVDSRYSNRENTEKALRVNLGCNKTAALTVTNGLYGQTLGKSWMTNADCTGSENDISQCSFDVLGEKRTYSNNAGVICTDSIPIRLTDGDTPTSGRVEVYIDGKWGYVTVTGKTAVTARVICSHIGTSSSATKAFPVNSGFYGKSSSIAWLTSLQCSSVTDRLENCAHQVSSEFLTSVNFGVVCQDRDSFSVRLANNETAYRGYVEILLGGVWGTISPFYSSYTYWDRKEATVVCRELGLPYSVSLPVTNSLFGSRHTVRWVEKIICSGTEQSLLDCDIDPGSVSYISAPKAGVICTDISDVQYRITSNTSAGRIEILIDGTWGGINKKSWSKKSASLLCKHLQKPFSHALPVVNDAFGFSFWEWLTSVNCYGTETDLIKCPNDVTGRYGTVGVGSAGVVCTDYDNLSIRLYNGSSAGRVEVLLDGIWGGIDASTWTHSKATIVCNQIGLQGRNGFAVTSSLYGTSSTLTWLKVGGSCSSDVQILSCNVDVMAKHLSPRQEAGVICTEFSNDLLEIYNGSSYGTLRVFLDNEWGTLNADNWGEKEAIVACRQLGLISTKALAVTSEYFGPLGDRLWIQEFKCTGSERNILECPLSIYGYLDVHVKDAGLICQDRESFTIRLTGNNSTQGVVEVFLADTWGTIDPTNWDNNGAKSVCRHLQIPSRFSFAVKSGIFNQEISHQWLSRASCTGSEPTLFDCRLFVSGQIETTKAAAVICTGSPEVRLVQANNSKSGLIELTIEGEKGYVSPVGANEAKVICRQLGYSTNIAYYEGSTAFPAIYGRRWASLVSCLGTEESVFDCSLTIDGAFKTEHYAYLSCEDSFKLSVVDGIGHHQGTLRLSLGNLHGYIYPQSQSYWSVAAAKVACRQLGFPTYKVFIYKYFARKTGWQLISYLICSGNERQIGQCNKSYKKGFLTTYFSGLICTGLDDFVVRLSDGQYGRGRVEVSVGGVWGSVASSSGWTSGNNARVVCASLGFETGVAVTNGTYLYGTGPVWIRDLICGGNERSIRDCTFTISGTNFYSRSSSSPDVGVVCVNSLYTRSTTLSTVTSDSSHGIQLKNVSTNDSSPTNEDVIAANTPKPKILKEVVHENTGMFVAIAVAVFLVAVLIVLGVCWKFRKGSKSCGFKANENNTRNTEDIPNDMEQDGYQTVPFSTSKGNHIEFNQNATTRSEGNMPCSSSKTDPKTIESPCLQKDISFELKNIHQP